MTQQAFAKRAIVVATPTKQDIAVKTNSFDYHAAKRIKNALERRYRDRCRCVHTKEFDKLLIPVEYYDDLNSYWMQLETEPAFCDCVNDLKQLVMPRRKDLKANNTPEPVAIVVNFQLEPEIEYA